MKEQTKYKEVRINDIYDIKEGDIVIWNDGSYAIVIDVVDTFFHNHRYVKTVKYDFEEGSISYSDCFFEHFDRGEIILRKQNEKTNKY